ncbi:MAG: hypothetical protein LBS36_04110 [Oscillospiraceae bacterium]|jgi:hypothetical protein|nr:hypothetical protein [Oscillospiraceae bacterium]
MENKELTERAKLYMEQLASGKDPFSGENVPFDTLLSNERLQRCFSFVAGVLGEVIANGGVTKKTVVAGKLPFAVSPEQQAQIELSEDAVGVNTLAKRIAAVLPPEMKRLSGAQINTWCVLQGFLREDVYGGKPRKVSTPGGNRLGITTIDIKSPQGVEVKKNIFDKQAQQFVMERLNEISCALASLEESNE